MEGSAVDGRADADLSAVDGDLFLKFPLLPEEAVHGRSLGACFVLVLLASFADIDFGAIEKVWSPACGSR